MDEMILEQEIAALIAPHPGPRASGRDLDAGFELNELEMAAREPEEPSIQGVSAVDTRDWRAITKQARELLAQSKDLRVAVLYTRALLHTHGLAGFGHGLRLVRTLVEHTWSDCYPALDDDGDAQGRLNVIGELWTPSMLAQLRSSMVLSVRELGTFTVDDVLVAKSSPLGQPANVKHDVQDVLRAIEHGAADDLRRLRGVLDRACADVPKLGALIAAAAPSGGVLNYGALVALPGDRSKGLLDTLAKALAENERVEEAGDLPSLTHESEHAGAPKSRAISDIDSREDVLRVLDRICEFYMRREPASPVPLALKRVKRLVTMDFFELLRELADQGVPQFEAFVGKSGS